MKTTPWIGFAPLVALILIGLSNVQAAQLTYTASPSGLTGQVTLSSDQATVTDWINVGLAASTDLSRKNGANQIVGPAPIGTPFGNFGNVERFDRFNTLPVLHSWTGGSATLPSVATSTNTVANTGTGVFSATLAGSGVGSGQSLTVPADTTLRTLRLYVGAYKGIGQLDVSLSDGSAPAIQDFSLNDTVLAGTPGLEKVYTIRYQANSAAQTLNVNWTLRSTTAPILAPVGTVATLNAAITSGATVTALTVTGLNNPIEANGFVTIANASGNSQTFQVLNAVGTGGTSIAVVGTPTANANYAVGNLLSGAAQLTSALVSGTTYTSFSVAPLSVALPAGSIIVLGTGATPQSAIVSSNAAVNATTLAVSSFTANAAYPIGTALTSTATTLATTLTSGVPVTSIVTSPLPTTLSVGASIVISNGTSTQFATLSVFAATGATTVSINSITPTVTFAAGSSVSASVPTLTVAVPASATTTLTVTPIPIAMATGSTVVISNGTTTQIATMSAAATVNATTITVTSVTPTVVYPIGSTVTFGQAAFIQAASLGTGSAGSLNGSLATAGNIARAINLSSDSSFGTLTTALVKGTSYTNLAVTAVTDAIPQGAAITIGGNLRVTQTAVTTAAVTAGATSIPIVSITSNDNYAVAAPVGFTNDDWIHWDLNPYQPLFTRKANVTREISNFQQIGSASPTAFPGLTTNNFGNFNFGFSCNAKDGIPIPTFFEGSNAGRILYSNSAQVAGRGFSFTVPADTTPRVLTFYGWTNADATAVLQINATLSDGSTSVYTDTFSNPTNIFQNFTCSIAFAAASSKQSLTVNYILTTTSGGTNHGLYGLTLRNAGLLQAPAADSIGIQFPATGNALTLHAPAGVNSRIGWNAMPALAQSPTPVPLVDNAGNSSGATVTWKADGLAVIGLADNQGNFRLMNGYLDTPNGSAGPTTVNINGIPAYLTKTGYSVYVYVDGNNAAVAQNATYTLNGTPLSLQDAVSTNFISGTGGASGTGLFTQVTSNSFAAGNVIKFTGLTATNLTLVATAQTAGTGRAPINAIQIVADNTVASTDFVWNGSVDANWSTAGNWTPAGPPTAGSNLTFPAGAGNTANTNNLTAGTVFNSIAITGTGYSIGGSSVQLTTSLSVTTGTSAVSLPIKASAATMGLTINANATLNLGAAIDANVASVTASVGTNGLLNFASGGGLTTTGANGYTFTVNGNGTFTASSGSAINFPSGTLLTNNLNINTPSATLAGAVTATAQANAAAVSIPIANGTININPTSSTGIAALNIGGNGTTNIGGALTNLAASTSILTPTVNITANITHTLPSTTPVAGAGTISPTGATTVNGTGTSFLTAALPGDILVAAGVQYQITAVNSNTQLVTNTAVTAGASIGYSIVKTGAFAIAGMGTVTTANNAGGITTGNGTAFNSQLMINDFIVVNGVQVQVIGINSATSLATNPIVPQPQTNVPFQILRPNSVTINTFNLSQAGGTTISAGNLNLNVLTPLQNFPTTTPTNNATLAGTISGSQPAIAGASTITTVAGSQTVTAAATAFSTVPNGQWASVGDTIVVTFQGITQSQLITGVTSATVVTVAAPFNPAITAATSFTILRGTATFAGSGVISQTGPLGNGAGVLTQGFGNVNILMSSASGVFIASSGNSLNSPVILNSGFILLGANNALGTNEIVYNGGMLQAYLTNVSLPNYFIFNYGAAGTGVVTGLGNLGVNQGANNTIFPNIGGTNNVSTAFTTQLQIGDSISSAGVTNFVTGIKADNLATVAGSTAGLNVTAFTINRSLVIGPTPNSFAAIGAFGQAFDLTLTGTTTMNNAARTIIVNSTSPNGLILNNATQVPNITAANFTLNAATQAGSVVTFTTTAAHSFVIGNTVTIYNVTPLGYNGNYVVTSVPSTTTFTVTNTLTLAAGSAFGTAGIAITEGNLLCGTTASNTARTLTKSGPGQLTVRGGGTGYGLGGGLLGQLFVLGGTAVADTNGILGPGSANPNAQNTAPQTTDIRIESGCNVVFDYGNATQIVGQGTISSAGTAVTGVGSTFTNTVLAGDMIVAGTPPQTQVINTATSATALTTIVAFSPALTAGTTYKIIRNKVFIRDSIALNGTAAQLQVKGIGGAGAPNTLTTMANFFNQNGTGIVKLSNASGSTAGAGDTNLIVRTNMFSNSGVNQGIQNFGINSLFTSSPVSTNNSAAVLSFVRDSSSGGAGNTFFQVNFGPAPSDNMPISWMKVTTQTNSPATTLVDQPAKYTGPTVTKQGFVPLTTGTVYTSLASGDWSNSANWTPTGVPGGTDQAIINANHVIDLKGTAQSIATLTFDRSGSIVSTTGAVNFTINSLVQTSYAYATPSMDANVNIVLGNSVQIDTLGINGTLTINGTISGPYAVIKTGIGELKLPNGNSTYSGGTILGSSSTQASFNLNAGVVAGNVVTFTTTANHSFLLGNNVTITGVTPATLNGTYTITTVTAANQFTVINNTAGITTATGFGAAALAIQNLCGGTLTLGADTTPAIRTLSTDVVTAGPIGTGPLTWSAPQFAVAYPITILQASGTVGTVRKIANNMVTGFNVGNDILTIGGQGPVTPDFTFTGDLTLTNTAILFIQNGRTLFDQPGVIKGAFALQKVGTGTLALGAQNTFTGGFQLGNAGGGSGGFGTVELLVDTIGTNPPISGPLGTGTFSMQQWAPGTAAHLGEPTILSGGTGARTITNTLNLSGNFVVTGNDLNLGFAGVNAALTGTRVITVNNTNTTINGSITGVGFGLTKDGAGKLILPGNSTYTGSTTILNGVLSLPTDTGRLSGTSAITVNAGGIFDISFPSTLVVATNNIDHINDAATLNLNGGTFQYVTSFYNVNLTETVGAINVMSSSTLTLDASQNVASPGNLQLTSGASAFNFNSGAVLNFVRLAPGAGGTTNLFLTGAPAGDTNVPQATVNGQVAEYDNTVPDGLRAKTSVGSFISQASGTNNWSDTGTWVGGVVPGASDNVIIRSAVKADQASQACNSLSFDQSGGSIAGTAGNVLTVTSGIINSGVGASPATASISVITLNFGSATALITQNSTSDMTISGPITSTSTGGVTVGGSGKTNLSGVLSFSGGLRVVGGTTVLSNSNTYTGGTVVSAGQLNISNDNNLGVVSGPLTIQGAYSANQPNGNAQVVAPTFNATPTGTLTTPGTAATTTAALTTGTAVTVINVASVPFNIAANATVMLSSGANVQPVVVPNAVTAGGATAITVTSFVPAVTFPIGSSLNMSNQIIGAGTNFKKQVQVGDTILAGNGAGVVTSILNDTTLTVGTPVPSLTAATYSVLHGAGVIGSGTIAPAASFTGYGTAATANGSATVIGTGTNFLTQLLPGDVVTIGAQTMTVSTVTGPGTFTATAAASGIVATTSYTVARSNLYAGTNTQFTGMGIGTITTAASTAVTGFGTSFLTQLLPGMQVSANGATFIVASISSNTALTTVGNPVSVQTQVPFYFGPSVNVNGTSTISPIGVGVGVGDKIVANGQVQTINNVSNPFTLSTANAITGLTAGTPYLIIRPQGVTAQAVGNPTITGLAMTYSFNGTGNLNCTAGSATVNQGAAGVNFIQQLLPGDIVNIGGSATVTGNIAVVQSIVSATQFIATAPLGVTTTNAGYQIVRPNVIGVNTQFTKTVNLGDYIYAGGQVQQVAMILDDTHISTALGFNPPLPPGTTFSIQRNINAVGTITFNNSANGLGTGTNFLNQVAPGDFIYTNPTVNGNANNMAMVLSVLDDTHLTITGQTLNVINAPYVILRGSAVGGGTVAVTSNDVLLNPNRGFILGPQGASVFVGANLTFTVNSALIGNHPLNKNGPGRLTFANGNIVAASTSQRQACTFINQGQLRFGTANALGAIQNNVGTIINNSGLAFVATGATLEVGPTITTGASQNVFFTNNSNLAGFGNCNANFGGSVLVASGSLNVYHTLLATNDSFTVNAGNNGINAIAPGGSFTDNTVIYYYAGNGRIIPNMGGGFEGVHYAMSGIIQSGSFSDNNPEPGYMYVMPGATLALGGGLNSPVVMMGGTLGVTGGNQAFNGPNGSPGNGAISTANIPMLTIAAPTTITTDDVVNPGTARTLTVNGIMAGTAPINLVSTLPTGTLVLNCQNNSYSGTITVNSYGQLNALAAGSLGQAGNPATVQLKGGTLQVNSNMGVSFPGNVIVADSDVAGIYSQIQVQDNGTIFQNQTITLSNLTMGNQNLVTIGRNYFGQFNYQLSFNSATFTGTPTFNTLSALLRFDNPIGGNFGITKYGAMPLLLNGANTYTGATTVNGGQVILNSETALWLGTLSSIRAANSSSRRT